MEIQNDPQFSEFTPGSVVVYGFHGLCSVLSIEERAVSGESIRFYKLQVQKSALSRSKKLEPAIWLPVHSAKKAGLRPPVEKETLLVFGRTP